MTISIENNREFDVLLEEYKILKGEIKATLISVRQSLNLCLTGIAGLIAISPFIIDQELPTLFLISSLVFHGLVWNQLRQYMIVTEIATYLRKVIILRIRELLEKNLEVHESFKHLMSWEEEFIGISNVYGWQFSLI